MTNLRFNSRVSRWLTLVILMIGLMVTLFIGWREAAFERRQQEIGAIAHPSADPLAVPARRLSSCWMIWVGGGLLNILVAGLFYSQTRLREESERAREQLRIHDAATSALNRTLEQRVAERTAELERTNTELVRFKAIVDATSDVVNLVGLDRHFLYMNPSSKQVLGIDPSTDITQMQIKDLVPPRVMELFEREGFPTALREGAWTSEVALLHRDGHEIPVSIVGIIVKSADNKPQFMGCVARDISERKLVEQRLQEALKQEQELNRLKSNFVSMVTHEIRTPLAHILGSSEVLSRYYDRITSERRQEHLQTIGASVQRLGALTEDVLLFSRAEAGRMDFKPGVLDVWQLCTHIADELCSATNLRCPVALSLPVRKEEARGDEMLLRHILTNLVANAVKYSPAGQPVTLSMVRQGNDAVFMVRDQGAGIPAEELDQVFVPFYRGRNVSTIQGTGLGLVIVKHCVERHGGTIRIESREGEGTAVTVTLPLFDLQDHPEARTTGKG